MKNFHVYCTDYSYYIDCCVLIANVHIQDNVEIYYSDNEVCKNNKGVESEVV